VTPRSDRSPGSPGARWQQVVCLADDEVPLDEAALLIAASANPALDVTAHLEYLDDLAARVPDADTDALCALLFGTLGLGGNRHDYDDPRNSFLDQVLRRRLGLPISLSVLLIEVGRRCGLPLEGVGMPGHFLVRDRGAPELLIDPFSAGRRIDRAGCEAMLQASLGPDAKLSPAMLEPTGPRAVLARMLTNLDRSYLRRGDRAALGWVTRLRMAIPDRPVDETVELADRASRLGWTDDAADLLERAAARPGLSPAVSQRLQRHSAGLRASLN